MIEIAAASLALMTQRPEPPDPTDCAPRRHLSRGAPPPPIFAVERFQSPSQERARVAAFRCPDGRDWRIQLHAEGGQRAGWVLGSSCPRAVRWVEEAARLPIPSPSLARVPEVPPTATWFVLSSRFLNGAGHGAHMEITLIERRDGARNAIAAWAREGEALFTRCPVSQRVEPS